MAKKIILGVLGASILMGLAAPAYAQNDRSRGAKYKTPDSYSQNVVRENKNARSNQRGHRYNDNRWGAKTRTFNTRYRATIILTEDLVRSRRGPQKICTVSVHGPQARLVPKKRLRRIARNNCSRRAKIQINTWNKRGYNASKKRR